MKAVMDSTLRVTAIGYDVPHRKPDDWIFCCSPGCVHGRGHGRTFPSGVGGFFCEQHAAELAKIREQIELELHATTRWGGVNTIPGTKGRVLMGRGKAPLCCNPHCTNERSMGESYCWACADEGYMEEPA